MSTTPIQEIRAFVFDVDGVLTDSDIIITENGDLLRKMNVKDGMAISHAVKQGYDIFVITGGASLGVKIRLKRLGVKEVHIGIHDKLTVLKDILERHHIDASHVVYTGDDFNDAECLRYSGLSCTPADGEGKLKSIVDIVLDNNGGKTCVREIIEKVLTSQGKWMTA